MLGGKNKQQHQPLGYTLIEVMIVLAISGFMFVIAANFINGKQERASFTQGSNDTGSKLQGVVEDITDGHYSDVPLTCNVSGSVLSASTAASGTQGQTPNCVFFGKIVRFYSSGSGPADHYGVYSIAAARSIADFPDSLISAISGLTALSVIPQNLYVKSMTVKPASGADNTTAYNIGFVQGIGNVDSTGVYLSGAQQAIQLVYANTTSGAEADIAGNNIQPAKSATICLSDGSRYAEIFVGGETGPQASSNNDNQLNISVQQLGSAPC